MPDGTAVDILMQKWQELWDPGMGSWLRAEWPELDLYMVCPECETLAPICLVITELNDHHAWSRGRIADWLDGLSD